ncbi:MAG: phosphoribosylglycinamide formyltransferase [Alphaproteobacteria bacterium]
MKKKVAILISGRGSNMAALIEAAKAPDFPAGIALVLSNKPEAPGLVIAHDQGLPAQAIDHRAFADRAAFDNEIDKALRAHEINIICLAGFMRIFTDAFVEKWRGRIINIHPSLLPAFKGRNVHKAALDAGVAISGCSVHFTVPELDAGPIIGQAAVPVRRGDTETTLETRVLEAEHHLYPQCLRLLCESKVRLETDRAVFAQGVEAPAFWRG